MAGNNYICNTAMVTMITLLFLNLYISGVDSAACEPIKLPMCHGMPYNMTRMPNLLYHSTQENAKLAIEQFEGLVSINCSRVLLFFLCTMYAPICTLDFQMDAIPPCRSVCMQARAGCEPIMKRYNVSWPSYLACEPLPEYDRGVCISPEAIVNSPPEVIDEDTFRVPISPERPIWPFFEGVEEDNNGGRQESEDTSAYGRAKKKGSCRQCPNTLKTKQSVYIDQAYEYVIRMRVESFTRENEFTMYTAVNVIDVLVHTDIFIPNGEVLLWTEDSCVCPKIYSNVEYVVMCYQDLYNGRLLLQEDCIIEEWSSNDWPRLVKKWNKKLKRAQRLAQEQVVTTRRPSSNDRRRTSSRRSRHGRDNRQNTQSRRERAAVYT
ncbi:secreted frizzled-related protein 3-like [Amphiura filiformis]|uniref:secreted frizzled-related protein 3-like n=1 Tax=Amphiura filiformis TaxID=82378 RepID=UPI003B213278